MQHLQLPDDLVPDGWFDLQVNQLEHRRNQVLCNTHPFGRLRGNTQIKHDSHMFVGERESINIDACFGYTVKLNIYFRQTCPSNLYSTLCKENYKSLYTLSDDACENQCV